MGVEKSSAVRYSGLSLDGEEGKGYRGEGSWYLRSRKAWLVESHTAPVPWKMGSGLNLTDYCPVACGRGWTLEKKESIKCVIR